MTTTIVWFQRDLRVDDHPALADAARRGAVVPVYVHDPDVGGDWAPGAASRWWLHHSLKALSERLEELGSPLVLLEGPADEALTKLARSVGADRLALTESIEPDAQEHDDHVEHELGKAGVETDRYAANLLWPVGSVMTKSGDPYQVFSPFWKAGMASGRSRPPRNSTHRPSRPSP